MADEMTSNGAKVYFSTKVEKVVDTLDTLGIGDFKGARVPIKLHMGRPRKSNKNYFISPSIVKLVVTKLKDLGAEPFLFDTPVAYSEARDTKEGYEKVAREFGFRRDTVGCDVIIGEAGVEVKEDGYSFEVAKEIHESSHLIVLSHVTGHGYSGLGGAIKNLGMGGMTRAAKQMIHHWCTPVYSEDKCDLCGDCVEVCYGHAITVDSEWKYDAATCEAWEGCGRCVTACPNGALSLLVMNLQKGLALAAQACVRGKRVLYINALTNISRGCDCDSEPGPIVCPDIGYLASNELAAIDKASWDLINEVKPKALSEETGVDGSKQIQYARKIGFNDSYELQRL
jgi:uncharacterized Fe-S center protein